MRNIISKLIEDLIKENLRVELVEWYDGSITARLFWGHVIIHESKATSGKLNE